MNQHETPLLHNIARTVIDMYIQMNNKEIQELANEINAVQQADNNSSDDIRYIAAMLSERVNGYVNRYIKEKL